MRDIVGGVAVSRAGMVIPVEVFCVVVRPSLGNDRPVVLQQCPQLSAKLFSHAKSWRVGNEQELRTSCISGKKASLRRHAPVCVRLLELASLALMLLSR